MIDSLPNRRLTEDEVETLQESDRFTDIHIRGRFLGLGPEIVEALVLTLPDGSERELSYNRTTGWELLEPINSDNDSDRRSDDSSDNSVEQ